MDEFKDVIVSKINNGFLVSYFPKRIKTSKGKCIEPIGYERITIFCKTLKKVTNRLAKIYE